MKQLSLLKVVIFPTIFLKNILKIVKFADIITNVKRCKGHWKTR